MSQNDFDTFKKNSPVQKAHLAGGQKLSKTAFFGQPQNLSWIISDMSNNDFDTFKKNSPVQKFLRSPFRGRGS